MPVRMQADIPKPDGTNVKSTDSMVYLGSFLSSDGRAGVELGRRIGEAKCSFDRLEKMWSHSSLSRLRQIEIFDGCVMSKLLYEA